MKTTSVNASRAELMQKLAGLMEIEPQVIVIFADKAFLEGNTDFATARQKYPDTHIIGCSSAGEISATGVLHGQGTLLAMHFDTTRVRVATAPLTNAEDSYEAGQKIAHDLAQTPGLRSIFTLSPGLNVNGSAVARGMTAAAPAGVVMTGGLAGDGTNFKETLTLLDAHVYKDHIVAFGLYGDDICVGTGSRGGWRPFGPIRQVTRVENNVLYELDGKPALELYKTYLAEKAAELPASGLLYPLSIVDEKDHQETGLIRTILDIDEKANSLVLAGELPPNSLVRLMHADIDALVDGATAAATQADQTEGVSATLMVSCVGRRLVMGQDVDEEVEAVRGVLGEASSYAGFYSYGELSPFNNAQGLELHNQTMTITTFHEKVHKG